MQELEKILEEIGVKIAGSMGKKRKGLLEAEEIIRKHLSRENDSETVRLSRDTEGTNEEINLSKEEFDMLRFDDSVTFRCGNEYVSLYMWEDEATRKYKHMNDSWISVEERLPEEKINPASQDFCEYQVTAKFGNVKDVRHYKYGNGHWWHGPGIVDEYVIAWRENPEPYRPVSGTDKPDWRDSMIRKFDRRG